MCVCVPQIRLQGLWISERSTNERAVPTDGGARETHVSSIIYCDCDCSDLLRCGKHRGCCLGPLVVAVHHAFFNILLNRFAVCLLPAGAWIWNAMQWAPFDAMVHGYYRCRRLGVIYVVNGKNWCATVFT
jgi:hypothetical protein